MISNELISRLTCAKFIFSNGIQILEGNLPYSEGLAVLSFHDATEMMLRAIAEHGHAPIRANSHFHQIIDSIEEGFGVSLSHRSALNQLNQSRVSFKHHGLLPQKSDARKFRHDLEGFFPTALQTFLNIDYAKLTLTDLIQHRRTLNWIRQGEAHINAGEYVESVVASAKAFAIFMQNYRTHILEEYRTRPPLEFKEMDRELEDYLLELDKTVDLIASGIVHDEYRRFASIAPIIQIASAGNLYVSPRLRDLPTYDDALFCSSFVIKTALELQTHYRKDRFSRIPLTRRFRVVKSTPIIVHPVKEGPNEVPQEVIWTPEINVKLIGYYQNYDRPGYTAVLQDGDCAYIDIGSVEPVD